MGSFQKGDKVEKSSVKTDKVSLPELGKDKFIRVRAMSAGEVKARNAKEKEIRASIEAQFPDLGKDAVDIKVSETPEMSAHGIIALCAVNDDGTPIFDDAADAETSLEEIAFASHIAIVKKIFELSGLTNIKDRTKN